jgi:hypothetical protein
MKQALHIFAKDARHLWPEISASLAITALFALIDSIIWRGEIGPVTQRMEELKQLAPVTMTLLPVSWWILITRLVQADSLVGDQQWWITKPYEWPQLLGAKFLFIGSFVVLPYLVAECVLLEEAGFRWTDYLPGVGFNLLLVFGILMLPLMALAAVTSGFGKATLTLLGAAAAMLLIAYLSDRFDTGRLESYGGNAGAALFAIVLLCSGGAFVLQYARRMAWRSRLVLGSSVVLMALVIAVSARAKLIAMAYPEAANPPFHAAFDPNGGHSPTTDAGNGRVGLSLPLTISGIANGTALRVDGLRATFTAADGKPWTSPWIPTYGLFYLPETEKSVLPVQVDRGFFDRAQSKPVTLSVALAITVLKAGDDHWVRMTSGEFAVPNLGICAPTGGWRAMNADGITCRSAMREPPLMFVSVWLPSVHCADPDEENATPGTGLVGQLIGDDSREPAEFELTGVFLSEARFQSWTDVDRNRRILHHPPLLCPETPIHFTPYTVDGRVQYGLTVENVTMPDIGRSFFKQK